MSGVGSPAYLAPAGYVASPEAMAQVFTAEEGRAYTAGWPPTTTKIFTS